jgi:hypothetical protein
MRMGAQWEPLAALPPPVATFAIWVLQNAMRETVPLSELQEHTATLFRAVHEVRAITHGKHGANPFPLCPLAWLCQQIITYIVACRS